MRILNVRLAVTIIIGVIVLVFVVYLTHDIQIRRQAPAFLVAADQAKEQKNLGQAIDYVYRYLALVPQSYEGRKKLGFWLAEGGRFGNAYPILEELLRSSDEEQQAEVRRKLVDVALAIRRYPDAEAHLRFLLQEAPDDAELLDLLGQCQAAVGQDRLAVDSFEHAIRLAPTQVDSYARLAAVFLRRLERPVDADKCMKEMVRVNPKSVKANLHLAGYLYRSGRFDETIQQAKKVLELAPENSGALWLASRSMLEKQKFDEAMDYATRAVKAAKDDGGMYILMADIKLHAGRSVEAIAALEQGLKVTKGTAGYGEILWHMANFHLDSGNTTEARKALDNLRHLNYPPQLLRCLEGRLELALEHWTAARDIFENVRRDLIDSPPLLKHVDYWIGQCYGQSGNIEQQLAAYRRAVAIDPFFLLARAGIADILINAGQLNAAIDEYLQAMKSGRPNEQTLLALARTLVLRNLRARPADRNWDEVERVLKLATDVASSSTQVPLLHAEALVAQHRMDEAERLLVQLRDADPDRIEFWSALASLAERQEKWDQADKLLVDAQKKVGDRVALRLARAQYLFRRYGSDAGPELVKLAENAGAFPADEQLRLMNGLIPFSIQSLDFDTAKRLSMWVATKEPHNVRIRYLLFELALRSRATRDRDALLAEIDHVLSEIEGIAGKGPLWLYGQAVRLTVQAKDNNEEVLSRALDYIARAREMRPTWSRLPLLAGGIYESEGKLDRAMDHYLQAINLGEHDPEIVRRTVQLLNQHERYAEATRVLERMDDQQTPLTQDLSKMRLDALLRTGDFEQALQVSQKAINENSKNYTDHIWAGNVLAVLARRAKSEGQTQTALQTQERAEKSFRRALELQDRSADAWVALIQFLANTDQSRKAKEALAEAEAKIPPRQSAVALAHCYQAIGDTDRAREKYEAALAAAPQSAFVVRHVAEFYLSTNNPGPAVPLLQRLIAAKRTASDLDVTWARRSLARVLLDRGGFPNLTEALRLVEENLAATPASRDDQRIKSRILLADPRRAKNREALALLEKLIQNGDRTTPEDRFDLAQLYLAQGDWGKYRVQMQSVLAAANAEPRHIIAYIRALVEHNETTEAEVYLGRVDPSLSEQFGIVSLRADILLRRNELDAMVDLLMSYVDRSNAQPPGRPDRVALAAQLLERFAERLTEPRQKPAATLCLQKAEKLYRSLAEQQPGQEMSLAAFFARQGRIRESLDLIEHHWTGAKPEVLSPILLLVIRSGATVPEQNQQVETILKAALKKHNRPTPLLIAMADFYAMQGQYADAEQYYREVMAKNPDNPIAMNNLGVVMALQGDKLEESLRLVQRAIEIAGPFAAMLDSRASVYIAMQQPDKALADLELALADDATPVRLFHQARAYHLAGKKTEAAAALEAAQKKNLKRPMLDPPERLIYDKLREELQAN